MKMNPEKKNEIFNLNAYLIGEHVYNVVPFVMECNKLICEVNINMNSIFKINNSHYAATTIHFNFHQNIVWPRFASFNQIVTQLFDNLVSPYFG